MKKILTTIFLSGSMLASSSALAVSPTAFTYPRDTNYNVGPILPIPDYSQQIAISSTVQAQNMTCPAGTAVACFSSVSGTNFVFAPNGTGLPVAGLVSDGTAWPAYNPQWPCFGWTSRGGTELSLIRVQSDVTGTQPKLSCYSNM